MSEDYWTGKASIKVLVKADIGRYKKVNVKIDPGSILINWDGGKNPDGSSSPYLNSTYTQGYLVSYIVYYDLLGYMYRDVGQQSYFNITTTDYFTNVTDTVIDIIPQNEWKYWNYQNKNRYKAAIGHVPSMLTFEATTTEGLWYTAYDIYLTVYYDIIVAKSCTESNINSDICKISCLNNLTSCIATYTGYCLGDNPSSRIAEPVCYNYFSKYIIENNSNRQIDEQAQKYCFPKYDNLTKVENSNPIDRDICSCNLQANDKDILATKLYDNYYQSLVKEIPAFKEFGSQPKCLWPACAAASFRSTVMGQACSVPQCITNVVVDNNGIIEGNINIKPSTNCNKYDNSIPLSDLLVITFIIVIIVIVVIIIIYVYILNESGKKISTKNMVRY
jgi:hypothetical protein